MYTTQNARRDTGFSLIELIVVMAIFAIVVSLTIPVIARARSRSQEVFCQSNLRTLWSALQQYTMDNQDRYPLGFGFNRTNPTTGRPTDAGASGYITWFSSIDMYLTSGATQIILLDANSGFFDGATNRNFHAAFKCPSVSSVFQQKVHYYQHGVVMPHLTLEIPSSFRPHGMPAVKPAKVNQLYPHTALIWDTPLYSGAAPVTPSMFWSTDHTVSGFAAFVTMIDDNVMTAAGENALLAHPEYPERRFRGPGADRFAASTNPLKNPSGPIAFPNDQLMQPFGLPSFNADFGTGGVFNPGGARFRHTGLGCNVLFADGSARTLYLRPYRKVSNAPPGQGSADFIDSDFRRNMLMIKWPPGITDTNTYPTN
jgi:prepilin-type N-terminal cleavage/methylation domain-containing protein/prepilin-type processing-associated H-X9-DG protein